MRWILLLPIVALAACNDGAAPDEQAKRDRADVAEVERASVLPPEPLEPATFDEGDIEKYDLYGAGCTFTPGDGAGKPILIALADKGYMKRGEELMILSPDMGSPEMPYLARSKYDGKAFSLRFTVEGEGKQTGTETADYPAHIVARDGRDRIVYEADGAAQCGA